MGMHTKGTCLTILHGVHTCSHEYTSSTKFGYGLGSQPGWIRFHEPPPKLHVEVTTNKHLPCCRTYEESLVACTHQYNIPYTRQSPTAEASFCRISISNLSQHPYCPSHFFALNQLWYTLDSGQSCSDKHILANGPRFSIYPKVPRKIHFEKIVKPNTFLRATTSPLLHHRRHTTR